MAKSYNKQSPTIIATLEKWQNLTIHNEIKIMASGLGPQVVGLLILILGSGGLLILVLGSGGLLILVLGSGLPVVIRQLWSTGCGCGQPVFCFLPILRIVSPQPKIHSINYKSQCVRTVMHLYKTSERY